MPPAAPIPVREIVVLTGGGADGAARVLSMLIQRAYRVQYFAFEVEEHRKLMVVRCGVALSWEDEELLLARLRRLALVVRATGISPAAGEVRARGGSPTDETAGATGDPRPR